MGDAVAALALDFDEAVSEIHHDFALFVGHAVDECVKLFSVFGTGYGCQCGCAFAQLFYFPDAHIGCYFCKCFVVGNQLHFYEF